jgi:Zn-dependent peptidase ImmA (M78 family)/DNA-binding XRE family transcriptional regulator
MRTHAIVKPELLRWARESSGLALETAAKKAGVKREKLEQWEQGPLMPTLRQLRMLANVYKRPLAVFYLPEPPRTFDAMHDFRRLPGEPTGQKTPELQLEIRRSIQRREVALDLYEAAEGTQPIAFTATGSVSDNPEGLGLRVRELLGIDHEQQIAWQNDYQAFNYWRLSLERLGVLVFQASNVDLNEMRGFSISETYLPTVVVNIKDPPRGRIFTMVHEFVHLMLRKGGVCDLDEGHRSRSEDQAVEVFCNHVAGAALVPRDDLLRDTAVARTTDLEGWSDEQIRGLAQRYRVSRETILRRLLILGKTTERFYSHKREELQLEYETMATSQAAGFAPPHLRALSNAGPFFARLVVDSYNREQITSSDVSDYLEIRIKHLPKIEQELLRRTG